MNNRKKIKILLLINWHIEYSLEENPNLQLSDQCFDESFWFFKHFDREVSVDVVDTRSLEWIEKFEKNKLKIYIVQTLKILKNINKYDVIISHGMTSAVFLDFIHQILKFKMPPHIVVDISSFNQASKKGIVLKLCQFASKSIDYLIYHTPSQEEYFDNYFPWLKEKEKFIPFGVDEEYWNKKIIDRISLEKYIVCVGYRRRDWDTLIRAYKNSKKKYKLILIGNSKLMIDDDMIEVKPFLPVDQLMKYIKGAEFCVLPLDSLNFSYGQMTLLQQMAIGKVVLLSDVPSVLPYQSAGLIRYQSNNIEDMTEHLNAMFSMSSNRLKKLGLLNIECCKNKYSERSMAKEFERIIINTIEAYHE